MEIFYDYVLGFGVDDIVYNGIFNSIQVAIKIINLEAILSNTTLEQFIQVNIKASELEIGPKIFDIHINKEEKQIYLIMDLLEIDLDTWIKYKYNTGIDFEIIKTCVFNIVSKLTNKLIQNNITIGDNNLNNYMCKNDKWYRIDYTQSILKNSEKNSKKHKKFLIQNPKTLLFESVYLN